MSAQSGRSSTTGWTVESSFLSAPLTPVSGALNSLGIAATNPLRFIIVEPNGGYPINPTKDLGVTEIDGDFELHRNTLTGKLYDGKDSFKLDPENVYYPALGITGRDVESTLTAGVYDHVMYHSFPAYMPSFAQEEQFGNAVSGRLSTGVCFVGLTITHSATLMAEITYYAHRQIPNRLPGPAGTDVDYDFTSTPALLPSQLGGDNTKTIKLTLTPSLVDVAEGNCGNGPLVFGNMKPGTAAGFNGAFVTLNDVPYGAQILPGFTVEITREVERFMIGGSGFDVGASVAGVYQVKGKIDILFADNTIPEATLANCKFGLNMLFRGAEIGSTGFYYEYELYIPRLKFTSSTVTRTDKAVQTGGNYQATKDAVLGYSCKIRLRNAFTHASLAGQVPQAGNGLGGWTAAA